ncbi:hypothetical protein M413DRAFT_443659 [Hebeloma cylindrosporum]|uniref:Phospholipid/glycerol acyltransferase domain-containing protein n=1 Tax=Hebeloma cylindrosporum TaxID=76867 RepID=A0A0C2YRV0_HEBCY|nr:hypothetical protein M413DRAFT_443659 [Hebeloma cylindrosporum h7]
MELKLVYRALRKVSDWTIAGYYSETYVEGKENVPEDGPLIIASTHHNEIIDIATLAATIPHRRHVSFWAKSTMFANPVTGAILSSSGAIPVRRNPNSNGGSNSPKDPSTSTAAAKSSELASRSALFRETSKALANDQVIGASIIQILPGAAWAAVEYARYVHDRVVDRGSINGKGKAREVPLNTRLRIVPVAIVYTDKSQYQSRVHIGEVSTSLAHYLHSDLLNFNLRYGEPIFVDNYADELFEGDADDAAKAVVKKITAQVEKQLKEMTINAPDWDTICAVSMARNILWEDERNIPLKDWVEISQRLAQMFVEGGEVPLKGALTKYYALLHYTNTKHAILLSLLPISALSMLDIPPPNSVPASAILVRPTLSILSSLPVSLIRLILFLPSLLLHFPGYFTGPLLSKCLATPGEEEGPAQFKAVGAGLGIGANIALALGILWKKNKFGTLLGLGDDGGMALLKRVVGLVGVIYFGVVALVKWHKFLVGGTLQRLLAYRKLLSTFVFSRRADTLSTAEATAYMKPPLPAVNVFIKRREAQDAPSSTGASGTPDPLPPTKLVRHLLHARSEACAALSVRLQAIGHETLLAFLLSKGAKIPIP